MSATHLPPRVAGGPVRASRRDDAGVREFLALSLADEQYALPLSCVREILRVPFITPVPRAASDVLGIIPVRGQVLTLVDLRRRLNLPCAPLTTKARVLLVDNLGETIGLLCDRVLEVCRLGEQEVELASVLGADSSSYVMGIGRPARVAASAPSGPTGKRKQARATRSTVPDMLILLDPLALLKRLGHV